MIHSVTKYLGGHGTTMGGVVVESGKFPWDNGSFPQMTEPSRGYHGVRFYETFGDFGFTMKARMETMRTLGPDAVAVLGVPAAAGDRDAAPADATRHWPTAHASREAPRGASAVAWVNYPGLGSGRRPVATTPWRDATCRTAPAASSRSASRQGRRCAAAGERFIEAVQFLLASRQRRRREDAGDPSGLDHPSPARPTTSSAAAGVTPEMIRLSVGLESLDDILWDLDQALAASR